MLVTRCNMNNTLKLSIGLLVSNRIDTTEKCLESVKPLKDAGIAEIIAIDTVGENTDGSAEIAREYADYFGSFKWVNDFSAARNELLNHSKGEWFMFLDDDEWFEDVSEIIEFFESGEYRNYNTATYIQRNYTVRDGSEWGDATVLRMCKRTDSLKFEGRIHEHFDRASLPCKSLNSYVHHYGYIYDTDEERKRHHERNVPLLELEIKDAPDDLRLRTQMALELSSFDNERALSYVREMLDKFKNNPFEPNYQWMTVLQFPLFEALGYDVFTAEKEYSLLEGLGFLKETAELSANYHLARICLIKEDPVQAEKHIKEYLRYYEILANDVKKQQLQDAVDFKRYLAPEYKKTMEDYLSYCMSVGSGAHASDPEGETQENYGDEADRLRLLQELPITEFMQHVTRLTTASIQCFEDPFFERVLTYFEERDPIKFLGTLYKMSETELKKAVSRGITGPVIPSLIKESAGAARKMYELIYTPESLSQKGIIWLSDECRFNALITGFLKGGEKDFKVLLEAAKIRPDMAPVIKSWIAEYK